MTDINKNRPDAIRAVLAFMFGLGALALYEDRALPPKPQYEAGLVQKAARDYKVECSGCHGMSGKGDGPDALKLDTVVQDFTRPVFWGEGAMNDMIIVITKGEPPDMPAFGDRLSNEEILAIAGYIQSSFRPPAGGH